MNRHYWDALGDYTLRKLKEEGLSLPKIAAEMGLSFNTVRRRWRRLQGCPDDYTRGLRCSCGKAIINSAKTGMCRACRLADPAFVAKRVEGIKAKWRLPEFREVMGQRGPKISETKMGWCPPAYRADYLYFTRRLHLKADEARRLVRDQIKADKARVEARLSPFDRQMRALERGAQLVANDARPGLDRPGVYSFNERAA